MKILKNRFLLSTVALVMLAAAIVAGQSINSQTTPNVNFNSNTPTADAGFVAATFKVAGPNAIVEVATQQGSVNNIAFAISFVINPSLGSVQQVVCTTPGAALTPSITGLKAGQLFTFIFVQNGTTACTITYPSAMHGGTAPSATLSSIDVQDFVVSNNGTDAYATGAAATGLSGGTP